MNTKLTLKQFMEMGAGAAGGGAPVNNVGSGNIAGLGVGPQGEPGGPNPLFKKKKSDVLKRFDKK
jgi:hypothetical protein